MRHRSVEELCRALGDWHGTWGAIPTTGHSKRDRGTTISISSASRLGFVVGCFNGDPRQAWRDVCGLLSIDVVDIGDESLTSPVRKARASSSNRGADTRRTVERIVAGCQDISGSPADDYLQSRGLKPPFPRDLRFHAELWTIGRDGERLRAPGLVGLIRRAPGSRVIGIHRTFLTVDGRKSPQVRVAKAMLGEAKGGAVWPDEFGTILAIAEGIESSLSYTRLSGVPCAAALSTSGLQGIRVPASVAEIVLAADHDSSGAGERAAAAAARRLWRPHRRVRVLMPETHGDYNDLLTGGCRG